MAKQMLTNEKIWNALPALRKVGRQKMPLLRSFELALTVRSLQDIGETLTEMQKKLMDEHGERDEKTGRLVPGLIPGTWALKDEEAFRKEWEALMEKENEVEIRSMDAWDLGEDFEIEPIDFEALLSAGILTFDPENKPEKEEQ